MSQAGVEMGTPELSPCAPAQGMDEHKLGPRMFAIAVAAALAAEAAGTPDLDPVRGAVDGAVEAGWVDERFDEQQRVASGSMQATLRRGDVAANGCWARRV